MLLMIIAGQERKGYHCTSTSNFVSANEWNLKVQGLTERVVRHDTKNSTYVIINGSWIRFCVLLWQHQSLLAVVGDFFSFR